MPTYYFMVGIPGSGKSTYAESLGCKVVCPDTIREIKLVESKDAFAIASWEIISGLKAGGDVVFDATNTIQTHRFERINVPKPYADKIICIWMDTPLEICIARHLERMKRGIRTTLPISVIERMARQLADNPPDISEGFNEIKRIVY